MNGEGCLPNISPVISKIQGFKIGSLSVLVAPVRKPASKADTGAQALMLQVADSTMGESDLTK
jgi:hypothetical protein